LTSFNSEKSLLEILYIIRDYSFEQFKSITSSIKSFPKQSLDIFWEILCENKENIQFYKYILLLISHIKGIPERLPEGFLDFINERLTLKEDDYSYILKCSFLLKEEAFFIFDSILKDKKSTLSERVECFTTFSKIKAYCQYSELIEEMASKELKPSANFLLFKWSASCIFGSSNSDLLKKCLNLIELDSPYDKVIVELLSRFDYSRDENLTIALTGIFSNKKILNNSDWIFSIFTNMEATNTGFKRKMLLFLKNWFENSKRFENKSIDITSISLSEIVDHYFSNNQNRELYNELKKLLKISDNDVYEMVSKKYLSIVEKIPDVYQSYFKSILKIREKREKLIFSHKLEGIRHQPNKNNFFDLYLYLKLIHRYGDVTYISALKDCIDIVKDEHLIALFIKIIGQIKINNARDIVEKYKEFPSFTVIGNVVWTLGRLDFHEKTIRIFKFVSHENDWVRLQAWIALRNCKALNLSHDKIIEHLMIEKFPAAKIEIIKTSLYFNKDLELARKMLKICTYQEEVIEIVSIFDWEELLDDIPDKFSKIKEYFIKPDSIKNFINNKKTIENLIMIYPNEKAIKTIMSYYADDKKIKYLVKKLCTDKGIKKIINDEIIKAISENC